MEAILLYIGKMILCSGVLFSYYQLFLRDRTFHHYNRFYLVGVLLVSLVLPLLKIDYFTIEVDSSMYILLSKFQNFNTANTENHDYIYLQYAAYALGLVSFFFLAKLAYGIVKIIQFKRTFSEENIQGIKFYQTNLLDAPFSFFRNLFWKDTILLQSDLGRQILKHEMVHIEQKHSIDKLLSEVLVAVFWFNPFFHIIKKEISLIHEYLADKKSVKNSDTKAFAQMLLASHFSGKVLPATSPFLSSNLKKRLKMLQKPKTKYSYARRLFALPILFVMAFAYLVNAKNREIRATNIEIEEAVKMIEQDTISPKKEVTAKLIEIQEKPKDIVELSNKLKEKSSELKALTPNSKEFSSKMEEINDLTGKISDIAKINAIEPRGEGYENMMKYMSDALNAKELFNGDFKFIESTSSKELKEQLAKNKEYFNSKEYKEAFEQGKDFFNSAQGKEVLKNMNFKLENITLKELELVNKEVSKRAAEANKLAAEASKIANEEIRKSNVYRLESVFYDDAKARQNLTKKEQKKLNELNKKQKELAVEAAKLAKERAKLLKTDKYITSSSRYTFTPATPKAPTPPKSPLKTEPGWMLNVNAYPATKGEGFSSNDSYKSDSYTKITIDGKEASKQDLKDLDPKKIDHISVFKNNNDGQKASEIEVTLKK